MTKSKVEEHLAKSVFNMKKFDELEITHQQIKNTQNSIEDEIDTMIHVVDELMSLSMFKINETEDIKKQL